MTGSGVALEFFADNALRRFRLSNPPPDAILESGLWAWSRNPNYLGEMLVYGSFAMLVWHWWPWVVLGWIWVTLFATNMVMKEASLSRYPGWAEYRRRSWWLVPFVL